MRRKVIVGIAGILPTEACGIPDSELADFMMFDLTSPGGKPVIGFKYCPWCGKQRTGEYRITETTESEEDQSGESWKTTSDS